MKEQTDQILGVERHVIERFLVLFRDLYKKADLANYFLELRAGTSGINVAITNQRDALSHMVTVLNNPDWTEEQKLEQLGNAEEHLRRAIIEPYERAVIVQMERVIGLFDEYKSNVLAQATTPPTWTLEQIRDELKAINALRQQARSAKQLNKSGADWEKGVTQFVDAFERLAELETRFETAILQAGTRVAPSGSPKSGLRNHSVLFGLLGGVLAYIVLHVLPRLF